LKWWTHTSLFENNGIGLKMFFIRHLHHGNWYQCGCGFAMAHSKGEVQKSPSKKFNTEECEMQKKFSMER